MAGGLGGPNTEVGKAILHPAILVTLGPARQQRE